MKRKQTNSKTKDRSGLVKVDHQIPIKPVAEGGHNSSNKSFNYNKNRTLEDLGFLSLLP